MGMEALYFFKIYSTKSLWITVYLLITQLSNMEVIFYYKNNPNPHFLLLFILFDNKYIIL